VADAGRDTDRPPAADEILALSDGRFGFKVVHPTTREHRAVFAYDAVREAGVQADRDERFRLFYVAMTRAKERLIVSGAIDNSTKTPIGWVLSQLACEKELAVATEPFELERGGATFLVRVDRPELVPVAAPEAVEADPEPGQLELFDELPTAPIERGYRLPELAPIPEPPLHRVRKLSYSALALFDRCSYRYYAERVAGLREQRTGGVGGAGLAATEIGDAAHRLLELVDLAAPVAPDTAIVRTWYPDVTDAELERIAAFVSAYCGSELAQRIAALGRARPERPFAFEHDGVLLHGRLDVLHRDGAGALVLDYKTNTLGERLPAEIVEADYRLQQLVYALACFRAGAEEVEVVYAFLERGDAVVSATFTRAEIPELESELSAAIARINLGEFVPTPSEFTCSGCPALDVICAGPRLGGGWSPPREALATMA
jgi:ATP-dependent exoDNAse (exonuclease V) beta subunit